jgi:DnaK suppressor protein
VAEPDDPAADALQRDVEALEVAERDLDDLDAALRRLDAGTYGTCEVCGVSLAGERLAAEPLLRTCPEHTG